MQRKKGIGGSEAGAIVGMNPYSSPVKVFQDKVSEEIVEMDNETMRVGRDLENYVAQRFMEETGKKVRKSNFMYFSESHPFMLADVDRLVVGEKAILECKTANLYQANKWKDGNVPEMYYIQCQHYLAVLGFDTAYIAVLIMGKGFIWQKIERDEELIQYLVTIEQDFWENYVLAKRMPNPDGSQAAEEIINRYFPHSSGKTVALCGFEEKLQRREELGTLIDKMTTEQKQIEQELKQYLRQHDAEHGTSGLFSVSWKPITSKRIDTELLKKELPQIYQQYCKESSYRRFSIRMV